MVDRHAGFTLIELLIVLVIAGMMYTLIPALFGSGLAGAELKKATRQVAAGLRQTRNQAIKQHRDAVMTINVDDRVFKLDGQEKTFQIPKKIKLKVLAAQDDVERQGAAIRFFPDGSSNGGRVTLTSGDKTMNIDVAWLTGDVAIGD